MTDNEIIKALECCKDSYSSIECVECPYYCSNAIGDCVDELKVDALELINRQKAEIERLTESCEKVCVDFDDLQIRYDNLFDEAVALIKKKKTETVKEFTDRLLEKAIATRNYFEIKSIVTTVVKEMVGDAG